MPSETVAVVPLRSPGAGKTRLASALSVEDRAALAGAMVADVVAALEPHVDRVVVAAAGAAAAAAGSAVGAEVVRDPERIASLPVSRRLDAALAAALAQVGGRPTTLVVAADLPHLRACEVAAVLATDADVVVAPTADGGTGGLLRRSSATLATCYGPGSAARHLAAATRAGWRTQRLELAGFAHDLDVVDDLRRAHRPDAPPLGRRTAAVLSRLGWAATG